MSGTLAGESESTVFTRTAGRQAYDAVGSGIGAVLFLGMAVLLGSGVLASDLVMRLLGSLGFGFFGLFMAAGALTSLKRGTDSRVAEVGPDGVWLPEMGFLPWPEISEVRLEAMRGVGSSKAPATARYERLGFVPRDPSRKPSAATSLAWRMSRAYFALVRQMAPQLRVGGDEPAPFGVGAIELGSDFERLVETTRRFVPVLDQDRLRAARLAGRWQASSLGVSVARPDIDAISAGLAPGVAAVAEADHPVVKVDEPTPQPRAVFAPPKVGPLEVIFGIVPVAAPLLVIGSFVLPSVIDDSRNTGTALLILAILAAAFVVPGALQLIRLSSRIRSSRSRAASLQIGPEGIWTATTGLVPWSDVDEIRTERAGWVRQIGGPSYERWRLALTTTAGRAGGVRSDEIDARFDDVLDLIRLYHPVSETA